MIDIEMEIKGACFGLSLEEGPEGSTGVWCTWMVEDDGFWGLKEDSTFDAGWIQDQIDVLTIAREAVSRFHREKEND